MKTSSDATTLLRRMARLSSFLSNNDLTREAYFLQPMQLIQATLGFHVAVLYRILNRIDDALILEVSMVLDPEGQRPDLVQGNRLALSLENPDPAFCNEVWAYQRQEISVHNIPGRGCDLVGFLYLPENLGKGHLLGGDYCGAESAISNEEIDVCVIMCHLLSTILIKTQFEHLARIDRLTGLLNSQTIRESLQDAYRRRQRKPEGVTAVILCDVDHFKRINDTYGHIQGDVVLSTIGRILAAAIRQGIDHAGRYGGEEFLIICEDTPPSAGVAFAERLRQAIAETAFPKVGPSGLPEPGQAITLTMSLGVTWIQGQGPHQTVIEILAAADQALYHSKNNGRNQVTLAPPTSDICPKIKDQLPSP